MLKEDLISWAEWNSKDLYGMYLFEASEEKRSEILKKILKRRVKEEPLYMVGLHPEVLKKIGIKSIVNNNPENIKKLISVVGGKYFYSLLEKEAL